MDEFSFDTSGVVSAFGAPGRDDHRDFWQWSDLSPFVQGYVEALFASGVMVPGPDGPEPLLHPSFSDLDPSALALILRDCEAFQRSFPTWTSTEAGALFWRERQDGRYLLWPPLQPHLSEEGRVCVREVA